MSNPNMILTLQAGAARRAMGRCIDATLNLRSTLSEQAASRERLAQIYRGIGCLGDELKAVALRNV